MSPMRLGPILRELETLLEDLATQCHAIEEMAVLWSGDAGTKRPRDRDSLIAFQKLDLIAQSLHDLSSLAGAAALTELARAPVDTGMMRSNLRLTSMADRLLGTAAYATDGDEFLL